MLTGSTTYLPIFHPSIFYPISITTLVLLTKTDAPWIIPALLLAVMGLCEKDHLNNKLWKSILVAGGGVAILLLLMMFACHHRHFGCFICLAHTGMSFIYICSIAFDQAKRWEEAPYIYHGQGEQGRISQLKDDLPVMLSQYHPVEMPLCGICHVKPPRGTLFLVYVGECGHLYHSKCLREKYLCITCHFCRETLLK